MAIHDFFYGSISKANQAGLSPNHSECAGTCKGITSFDCEGRGTTIRCKNFEFAHFDDGAIECVSGCPDGTWIEDKIIVDNSVASAASVLAGNGEIPNLIRPVCSKCHDRQVMTHFTYSIFSTLLI